MQVGGRRRRRICDDRGMTLVIAHRGASRAEPENTVAAFRRAVEMGADGIELDVRRTLDDRLVVHHDPLLADGRVIRSTPAADLPPDVPGLDDALDACDGAFVNIEIKNDRTDPDFDASDWAMHRVASILQRRGIGPRWLVSSFRPATVRTCRRILPEVRTALLTYPLEAKQIERAASIGCVAVHPWVDLVDEASVLAAHRAGLMVSPWTCDDPGRMRELIAWGIDGICTNVPDVARAVRSGSLPGATGEHEPDRVGDVVDVET